MQFPISSGCRLQRDIFVIGLNDTFKHFRSDLISWENLTTLTFAQVISKARDFEASLKTESAMTRQQLEESVHQVTPGEDTASKVTPDAIKSKTPRAFLQTARRPCLLLVWLYTTSSSSWLYCSQWHLSPLWQRGHWQQVCRASTANTVTQAVDTDFEASTVHVTTHDVAQVQSASKGIFADLDLSPSLSSASAHCVRFQVQSGCSCNTIHVTDLRKMAPVKVTPSSVRLLHYSKTIILTWGQATLHCIHRGKPYDVVVQVITSENYYAPLLAWLIILAWASKIMTLTLSINFRLFPQPLCHLSVNWNLNKLNININNYLRGLVNWGISFHYSVVQK